MCTLREVREDAGVVAGGGIDAAGDQGFAVQGVGPHHPRLFRIFTYLMARSNGHIPGGMEHQERAQTGWNIPRRRESAAIWSDRQRADDEDDLEACCL